MNKHFVLTSGRSGSNYISDLLTRHPNVINYGEVLGQWTTGYKANKYLRIGNGDAGKYLDFIYRGKGYFQLSEGYQSLKAFVKPNQRPPQKSWSDIQSYGVKDFAMTLIDRGAADFLKNNPDIRVISLHRENALRRFASVHMLDETGVVSSAHAKDSSTAHKVKQQVYLDPETLIGDLKRTEKVVQDQLDMVAELPKERVLSIRYEDLFASEQSKHDFAQQMFEFIGVKPLDLESSHKKLNASNLQDLIQNYDEVFDICRGSDFERYFYY